MTTNAGTGLGVATDAVKISARLYPGAFIAGPNEQLLPNTDLVTATRSGEDPKRVDYVINKDATYSDGAPVVCDDYLLTYTASTRPDLFGADMPLFSQVAAIDCVAGSKKFAVHFQEGFGDRYRELFNAGTVMPAHTVLEHAEGLGDGSDVVSVLASGDPSALQALGASWQETFRVDGTDPATVPTSGPYRITSWTDDGGLVLETNPEWKGVKPAQSPIHMWPGSKDASALAEDNQLAVADLDFEQTPEDMGLTEPEYVSEKLDSSRVDTLRLWADGPLASAEGRRALNACIDRGTIAEALKKHSDVTVKTTGLRVVHPTHPLAPQLSDIAEANARVDMEQAKQLEGATIRIGYLESSSRYKVIVDAVKDSCAAAGITIENVPVTADDFGQLGQDYDVLLDTRSAFGRNSATNANIGSKLNDIRRAEQELADEAITIPLTTEPRSLVVEQHVHNVVDNAGDGGVSWNMDRWVESETTIHELNDAPEDQTAESHTSGPKDPV